VLGESDLEGSQIGSGGQPPSFQVLWRIGSGGQASDPEGKTVGSGGQENRIWRAAESDLEGSDVPEADRKSMAFKRKERRKFF
jgi:hypothetical protein